MVKSKTPTARERWCVLLKKFWKDGIPATHGHTLKGLWCLHIYTLLTSVRTVEDALKINIPANAELVRNIMHCTLYMHDHVVHFYHLHAMDWVDVVNALKADPKKLQNLHKVFHIGPKVLPVILATSRLVLASLWPAVSSAFCQRLLGTPCLQTAGRSKPDRSCTLSWSIGVAERNRKNPCHLRW